LFLGKNAILH